MGKLTHIVKGSIASFRSADKADIESLKLHFLPKQEGSGDPSPTNIRPITGWTGCNFWKSKKNVGHIYGYSTSSISTPSSTRYTSGSYGTTTNTTEYSLPDTSLVITQTDHSDSTIHSYRNGYICIGLDSLIFGQHYDVSFKISDITANPLDVSLYSFKLCNPSGGQASVSKVIDNVVIFKNVLFSQRSDRPYETDFQLRICGMSFTLSEFMVTPAYTSDGIFAPYEGSTIPLSWSDHGVEYGGYVDLVRGKLVAEWVTYTFTGTETDLRQNYRASNGTRLLLLFAHAGIQYGENGGVISNILRTTNNAHGDNVCYPRPSSQGCIIDFGRSTICDLTAEEFDALTNDEQVALGKTYIANLYSNGTPLIIAYKLVDPIEYDIDPIALQTFLDYNNFWSDTNDDTEVEYAFADRLSERKLIMDTPHIESTSDAVASFSTDMKAPIADLKAHFTPVQEGTGDPSPNNIRSINGHTGLNINQTGKNLINLSTASKQNNSSNIETTIVDNTITITAKKANGSGVLLQQTIYQDIPPALRGKEVYFGVGSVTLTTNNENHKATIVCEFKDIDGKFITDPTVVAWINGNNNNTVVRKTTIPENAAKLEIYFRIAQNASTYGIIIGDTVTYHNFYMRYPTEPYGNYEKYDGEMIPIEFPATKNLLNPTTNPIWNNGNYTINSDGSVTVAGSDGRGWTSNQIAPFILPKGTYTFSWTGSQRVQFTTSNDNYETVTTYNYSTSNGHFTFTLANDGGIKWKHTGDAALYPVTCFVQIEKGSSATAFEPYGTVYGGYVDPVRGKLVATHGIYTTVFGPSVSSSIIGDTERHGYYMNVQFKSANYLHGNGQGPYNLKRTFCNVAFWGWDYFGDYVHYYIDGNLAYIMLPIGTDPDTEIQFCAELATPIEYDLTPEQIKTLKGTNNIWSDANGDIEVKYWTH